MGFNSGFKGLIDLLNFSSIVFKGLKQITLCLVSQYARTYTK